MLGRLLFLFPLPWGRSSWAERVEVCSGGAGRQRARWAGRVGHGLDPQGAPFPCLGLIGVVAWPRVSTIPFFPLASCHGKAEECIGLCRALMSALIWLLHCAAFYAEKVKEALEQAAAENQLKMCLERLEKMLGSTKNRALIHIAKLEETCTSLPLVPGSCHLPFPLPSSCRIVPAARSPVAVTVSSLAPCHPLPPPLLAALGRGAELMPRLREPFPGARRVLSSASPPGTAPRLLSVLVPGQEAMPGSCWPARSPP